MREIVSVRKEPEERFLFPQDFREGEASPEELLRHRELARWTVEALKQAMETASGKDESGLKNLHDATTGTQRVIERRIDDDKL